LPSQRYTFDTHCQVRVHNDVANISNHLETRKCIKLVDCPALDNKEVETGVTSIGKTGLRNFKGYKTIVKWLCGHKFLISYCF